MYNFLERSSVFGEEVLRPDQPVIQICILLKVYCYHTYCCYVIQITYQSMKASQREQHSFPPFLNQHFSEKDLYWWNESKRCSLLTWSCPRSSEVCCASFSSSWVSQFFSVMSVCEHSSCQALHCGTVSFPQHL